MAGISTPGVTGSMKQGKTKSQIDIEMGQLMSSNATTLETGKSIISGRNTGNIAASAQALANQTGGNIMGFTYE